MNPFTIFNIAMGLVGLYLVPVTVKMKKTGQIPDLLLGADELKKVSDHKGFIDMIYMKQLLFCIVMAILGVFGAVFAFLKIVPHFNRLEVLVFTVFLVIFMKAFYGARSTFIGDYGDYF